MSGETSKQQISISLCLTQWYFCIFFSCSNFCLVCLCDCPPPPVCLDKQANRQKKITTSGNTRGSSVIPLISVTSSYYIALLSAVASNYIPETFVCALRKGAKGYSDVNDGGTMSIICCCWGAVAQCNPIMYFFFDNGRKEQQIVL
jgi:hypothetical protein